MFREWTPRRKDGSEVACLWANFKLPDGLVINLGHDIRERKKSEHELRQLSVELAHATRVMSMSELTVALGHELNHPLGSILNNANAAKKCLESTNPDMDEFRDIVDDIISENKRASAVIQKIMELMRKGEVELCPVQINNVLDDLLKFIHSELVIENISLSIQKGKDLPKINGDRVQLQQILLNVVINAIEAMKDTKNKCLHVSTATHSNDRVIICVADSGSGVDPKETDNVFEPFVTTKTEGLGMGLSIAKRIIDAHDGDIWIDDNKGGGARVSITLPAYRANSV